MAAISQKMNPTHMLLWGFSCTIARKLLQLLVRIVLCVGIIPLIYNHCHVNPYTLMTIMHTLTTR